MAEQVEHQEKGHRFVLRVEGQEAELTYRRQGSTIVFEHTGVPDALQHRGFANRLAKAALEHAREERLTVVPVCEFVAGYVEGHPEYRDLLGASNEERSA